MHYLPPPRFSVAKKTVRRFGQSVESERPTSGILADWKANGGNFDNDPMVNGGQQSGGPPD
jgi:hypothetical protein